ncbi:MAG: glycosyltransferase [Verrucomicrobia bacterium]|nr:glycosyltransferase [Verrucomicrobiota bacterium]
MNPVANASGGRPMIKVCPVCGNARVYYLFSTADFRMVRCEDCGLIFLNPQPSDQELAKIYAANCFPDGRENEEGRRVALEMRQATVKFYLSQIARYRGPGPGRLLEVGCGNGDLLAEAEAAGWDVTGIDYSAAACERARQRLTRGNVRCGELTGANLAENQFDLCIISDQLQNVRSPVKFLGEIHRLLKPGGTLFVTTLSTDSWPARFLRHKWMEFKAGHLTYFNRPTIQTALFRAAFRQVIVLPGWKILNFDHVKKRLDQFPVPVITPVVRMLARVLPKKTQLRPRRVVANGITIFSRKAEVHPRESLSVIVPAYNEAATFCALMDALLARELPDLHIEVVVVESHSTDGTRELAMKYKEHPRVKLILEDRPKGKGHAVRAGLKAATGDYVLIQDADLEYDLEDYDALLEPLRAGRAAFVLGSRHGGRNVMKMRQFAGQRSLSAFLNTGHWLFTSLINVLFLQRLRDPFTMFKVFRRDCLFGLEFECNRFDFDFELLIKLIRKGYRPVELPVNYRSRSFEEGKKVRMFRDPLTWLAALLRLRLARLSPLRAVEKKRRADQKARVFAIIAGAESPDPPSKTTP